MANRLEGKRVAFLSADGVAFCDKLVEENCEGRHEEQAQQTAGAAR